MYKVIYQDMVIDVIEYPYYVRWIERYNRPYPSDETSANGIGSSDNNTFYHVDTMPPFPEKCNFKTVKLVKISEEEYQNILSQITKGETIYYDEEEPTKEELLQRQINELQKTIIALSIQGQGLSDFVDGIKNSDKEDETELTPENIKLKKIEEMSIMCNKTIEEGFDVTLSDNTVHHFSLTIHDQLNLISLSTLVASSETEIPYHADGELCKFYSIEDIATIVSTATSFKSYHVSYFNSLRSYIESLESIYDVKNITYGIDIPEEYKSEVLKILNI